MEDLVKMQKEIERWIEGLKETISDRVLNQKDMLTAYYEDNDET